MIDITNHCLFFERRGVSLSSTIAAISTAPAAAGLGVIRISGPDALVIAEAVFRPADRKKRLSALPGYTALYGHVYDREGDVDECVALVFRGPRSYTGEDVVELSCHGGLYLTRRVLRAVLAAGASPAGPGEFTRRAFIGGKIDLTQAEAVMDLIAADSRVAARTALAAREGILYKRLETVREELVGAAAALSAFVDYPDDDIPELEGSELAAALRRAEGILTVLLSTFEAGRVAREGVDTVIAGSPNVGKSTLMNLLAGCERSIVTSAAGTTRDVVEETVRLGDVLLRLSDTAGIRRADNEAEKIGIDKARRRMSSAALLLCVFDGSRPLDDSDREVAEEAARQRGECPSIALINKTDKPLKIDEQYIIQHFQQVIHISALTGGGRDELERAVRLVTGIERLEGQETVLSTERQRVCAQRCLTAVQEALSAWEAGITSDAVGICLDDAISALLELTGERATEAVVEEIFARFCVGK